MHLKYTYGRKNFINLDKSRDVIKQLYKGYYGDQKNLTIIDAYPGAGIFSQALNEELKPRRHFLLEPFIAYHKHLEEQQWLRSSRPESQVYLSKSDPFRWSTFLDLEKQYPLDQWPRTEPHKTLIYHANLTAAQGEQLAMQYLNCITNQSWLQSFGRVKLLLWVRRSTAQKILAPIGSKARNRVSVQRESSCSGKVVIGKDFAGESLKGEPLEGEPLEGESLEGESLEGGPLEGGPLKKVGKTRGDHDLPDKADYYPNSGQLPVLIDLTPHEKQVEFLDSFEYVIKMLFILKNQPLRDSLNNLGPGASEYIGPKLTEGLIDCKPMHMKLEDFEQVTRAFEFWPFKPSFLHDFYED